MPAGLVLAPQAVANANNAASAAAKEPTLLFELADTLYTKLDSRRGAEDSPGQPAF